MSVDERSMLGIYTAGERQRHLETGSYEPIEVSEVASLRTESAEVEEVASQPSRNRSEAEPVEIKIVEPKEAHTSAELFENLTRTAVDSPLCFTCGTKMCPAGSCFVCEGCGSTSGCS